MSRIVVRAPKRNRDILIAEPPPNIDLSGRLPEPENSDANGTWEDDENTLSDHDTEDYRSLPEKDDSIFILHEKIIGKSMPKDSKVDTHFNSKETTESGEFSNIRALLQNEDTLSLRPIVFSSHDSLSMPRFGVLADVPTGSPRPKPLFDEPEPIVRHMSFARFSSFIQHDPVPKTSIKIEASFDLSELVRTVEAGPHLWAPDATQSQTIRDSALKASLLDESTTSDVVADNEWMQWAAAPSAHSYPAASYNSHHSRAHNNLLGYSQHANINPTSKSARKTAGAAMSSDVEWQQQQALHANLTEQSQRWTHALLDAWRQVQANDKCIQKSHDGSQLGMLPYFVIRSPRTDPYSPDQLRHAGTAETTLVQQTVSAFVCSSKHRAFLSTNYKDCLQDMSSSARKFAQEQKSCVVNDALEPVCVLSGASTALVLRLHELGVAPRVATHPGAVLPGVFANADAYGNTKQDAAVADRTAETTSIPSKPTTLLRKQQQQKDAAEIAQKLQAEAVAAVSAYGHTIFVIGTSEISIVIDVLCEAVHAALQPPPVDNVPHSSNSIGLSRLLTHVNTRRNMMRRSMLIQSAEDFLPRIVAPKPFHNSLPVRWRVSAHACTPRPSATSDANVVLCGDILPESVVNVVQLVKFLAIRSTNKAQQTSRDTVPFLDSRLYKRAEAVKRQLVAAGVAGARSTAVLQSSDTKNDLSLTRTIALPMRIFATKIDAGSGDSSVNGSAGIVSSRSDGRLMTGARPHYGGGALRPPPSSLTQRREMWNEAFADDAEDISIQPLDISNIPCFALTLGAADGQDGYRLAALGHLYSQSEISPASQMPPEDCTETLPLQFGVMGTEPHQWTAHTVHDVFWCAQTTPHDGLDVITSQPAAVEFHPASLLADVATRSRLKELVQLSLHDVENDRMSTDIIAEPPVEDSTAAIKKHGKYRARLGLDVGGLGYRYGSTVALPEGYVYGTRSGPAPQKTVVTLGNLHPYVPFAN